MEGRHNGPHVFFSSYFTKMFRKKQSKFQLPNFSSFFFLTDKDFHIIFELESVNWLENATRIWRISLSDLYLDYNSA